jgi:hypothetical protein
MTDPQQWFPCKPSDRDFPRQWAAYVFREESKPQDDGISRYSCPLCGVLFDHTQLESLAGDHIWPFSLFGDTTSSNYQLICATCNKQKSNAVDVDIRRVLGSGEFRRLVCEFLRLQLAQGQIADSPYLKNILSVV